MTKSLLFLFLLLSVYIARAQEGFPDPSFGTNGSVALPAFTDVAFQSDGKMIGIRTMSEDFVVSRYTVNGTPDASFGTGGTVTTNFGIPIIEFGMPNILPAQDQAYSVAIQPDGKIVVMGKTRYVPFPAQPPQPAIALARYNSNGTLDASFGRGGTVRYDLYSAHDADMMHKVAIGRDGKILVTYRSLGPGGNSIILEVFNANGSPGPGAGDFGRCCYFGEVATTLDVQLNGKIVVGGYLYNSFPPDAGTLFLTRLNTDGLRDASFGIAGTVLIPPYRTVISVAMQADGKLIVVPSPKVVLRLNESGSIDPTFGTGGIVHAPFEITEVIVQNDGKIITGGNYTEAGDNGHFIMARYNPDGSFDASFAYGGMTAIYLGGTRKLLHHLAVANDHLYAYGSGYLAAFSLQSASIGSVAGGGANDPLEYKPSGKLRVSALSNPSTTYFSLRLEGSSTEPVQIRIVDATGRTIEWKRKLAANTVLRLGDSYQSGMYYAEVMQGREKITGEL